MLFCPPQFSCSSVNAMLSTLCGLVSIIVSTLLNSPNLISRQSFLMRLSFHCISLVLITATQVGGLTVYLTGPLPLPTPPSWLSSFFGWLLAPEPPPPPIFSGATLEVQRLQRMDQIERMMIHAYNNRQVRLQLVIVSDNVLDHQ